MHKQVAALKSTLTSRLACYATADVQQQHGQDRGRKGKEGRGAGSKNKRKRGEGSSNEGGSDREVLAAMAFREGEQQALEEVLQKVQSWGNM